MYYVSTRNKEDRRTPLGVPVEPEVKIPYRGSVSRDWLRMAAL